MAIFSPTTYSLKYISVPGYTNVNVIALCISVSEAVGSKYRAVLGTLNQCFFSVGYMAMPLYAYYIRDDTSLQAVVTWPLFLFFIYSV